MLTASSSESYGFLFKLCCDPGDAVLVPEPSYPLFEYLTRLEGVVPVSYRLAFDGVWHVDFASLTRRSLQRAATATARAPSSSSTRTTRRARFSSATSWRGSRRPRRRRTWPSSPTRCSLAIRSRPTRRASPPPPPIPRSTRALPSSAWEVCPSPAGCRSSSSAGSSPVVVTPRARSPRWSSSPTPTCRWRRPCRRRSAICWRWAPRCAPRLRPASRKTGRDCSPRCRPNPVARCFPPRAGGRRSSRVPASRSDEAWAAALATEAGVLVQPGYFFDLRGGTFLVLSLLPVPDLFAAGIARLVAHVDSVLRY